jgi:diguanylate cyclase (GGDEF)-like protein
MANRRAWEHELPSALNRAQRLSHDLSVVLLDVDHFKAFNDAHGHPAGDRALREIGRRWRGQVRDIDVLARFGGVVFALLAPGYDIAATRAIADRLRADLPDGLTASAGAVAWSIPMTAEELVGRADRALYRAKGDGRDRTVVG